MSGLFENLPFKRGATYGVTDTTLATHLEGKEYIHEDQAYGTALNVRVRICRNNSGITLLGKRAAKFNVTAGKADQDVSGYTTVASERTYIIDDLLSPAGVPNGDLFYVVVEGPCLARTGLAADGTNVLNVGDFVHALTAATTAATTSGRVGPAVLTGATSVLVGQITNIVGRALSAKTTANTNADVLINAGRFG